MIDLCQGALCDLLVPDLCHPLHRFCYKLKCSAVLSLEQKTLKLIAIIDHSDTLAHDCILVPNCTCLAALLRSYGV